MNKLLLIIPFLLLGFLATYIALPGSESSVTETANMYTLKELQKNFTIEKLKPEPSQHVKDALNCKSCHSCEYPTMDDPCLVDCPKDSMVSVYHSPKEGPEYVYINEMANNYDGVIFSHRLHAEMSVISKGCSGCHHYNTTGPILNCRKCHETSRVRENIGIPDLKAAYHRQCLSCHREWSHENGCNTQCHEKKGNDTQKKRDDMIKTIAGKTHPEFPEPDKLIWETNYEYGKIVTFFHDEHVNLFKVECTSCHKQDNCSKCHKSKMQRDVSKPVKIVRSFDDHHKPCNECHVKEKCDKCHLDKEMTPFNHGRSSGWPLKSYHSKLSCERCHGANFNTSKLARNCTSCHSNFVKGKFNHSSVGLTLSAGHSGAECKSCHPNDDFGRNPVCTECHENEYSFPAQLPGKRR